MDFVDIIGMSYLAAVSCQYMSGGTYDYIVAINFYDFYVDNFFYKPLINGTRRPTRYHYLPE